MLSSIIVSLMALIFLIIFILYKRKNFPRILLSNDAEVSTKQFSRQLQQTADSVIAQLEGRISRLESLLAEADNKIFELEERLKVVDAVAKGNEHLKDEQAFLVNSIEHDKTNARQLGMEYSGKMNTKLDSDKCRLVLAMAEQGYNITEIAKATGTGKGEIMLLLQLNKR